MGTNDIPENVRRVMAAQAAENSRPTVVPLEGPGPFVFPEPAEQASATRVDAATFRLELRLTESKRRVQFLIPKRVLQELFALGNLPDRFS